MNINEIRAKYPQYEDMSNVEFAQKFHSKFYSDMDFGDFAKKIGVTVVNEPIKFGKDSMASSLRETMRGTDWGTRNIAGAGTSLSNLIEGVSQFVGKGDAQRIEANKIIRDEAPVGAIAGDVALTAVPFGMAGNSLKAAGAVGGAYGLMQPVSGEQSLGNIAKGKAINTLVGGATGAGGQALANKATGFVANKMAEKATEKSRNAVIDKTLQESLDAGYVVPPSMMPDSGITARVLEGISGKYKTNQLAGIRNQEITNNLARDAVGLPKDSPITVDALSKIREQSYGAYKDIASLPAMSNGNALLTGQKAFNPKAALEELKQARSDAKGWFDAYNRSADPSQLAKAKTFQSIADQLETDLESYAKSLGKNDLVDNLVKARKEIAKTYTVERALKDGSGNVDARVLGKLYDKQKPLSDGLDKVGKFASTFRDVSGVPKSGNANPFTIIDAGYSVAGGALNPAAYALPLARVASRYGLLSNPAQKAISSPLYEVSPALRMGGGLLGYSPIGGTVLGLESLR